MTILDTSVNNYQSNAGVPIDQGFIQYLTIGPQRGGESWRIDRITINNTGPQAGDQPRFYLYRNQAPANIPTVGLLGSAVQPPSSPLLIDGSYSGLFDVNILEQPLMLGPSDKLVGLWVGCSTGVNPGTTDWASGPLSNSVMSLIGEVYR